MCQKSHHFEVYQSVIFSIFTGLDSHHYCLILHFHHPQKKSIPIFHHSFFPSQLPLAMTKLLSVPMDLPALHISYKQSYNMWPFVSGFFTKMLCSQGSFTL